MDANKKAARERAIKNVTDQLDKLRDEDVLEALGAKRTSGEKERVDVDMLAPADLLSHDDVDSMTDFVANFKKHQQFGKDLGNLSDDDIKALADDILLNGVDKSTLDKVERKIKKVPEPIKTKPKAEEQALPKKPSTNFL